MPIKDTLPRFDYRAACAEVILPRLHLIPDALLFAYRLLRDAPEYADLRQDKGTLLVPIPDAIRASLEAHTCADISLAAALLHNLGHWSGTLDEGKRDTRGATWKFSDIADQILAEKLGLPKFSSWKEIGYRFRVHDGMLRIYASSPDFSTFRDLGPATPEFLAAAEQWRATLPLLPAGRYVRTGAAWQAFERGAFEALDSKAPAPLLDSMPEHWRALVTVCADYMRAPGKGSEDCPECGKQRLWDNPILNHEGTCPRYPWLRVGIENAVRTLREYLQRCEKEGLPDDATRIAKALDLLRSCTDGTKKEG